MSIEKVDRRDARAGLAGRFLEPGSWTSWLTTIACIVGFAAITTALALTHLPAFDIVVRDWLAEHRPAPAYWAARGLNYLGQGGPLTSLTLLVAVWLAYRYRSARPLLLWLCGLLLPYFVVGPVKIWSHRGAPGDDAPTAVELFSMPQCLEPRCMSYPSGHVINSIVWCAVLAILLGTYLGPRALFWLRIAPAAIVSVSTVYVGFHWLTDTLAAICLGLLFASLIHRIAWDSMPLPRWLTKWESKAGATPLE